MIMYRSFFHTVFRVLKVEIFLALKSKLSNVLETLKRKVHKKKQDEG